MGRRKQWNWTLTKVPLKLNTKPNSVLPGARVGRTPLSETH